MRASLVQRGRSEGRVSLAHELESAEEQDVDDRDVVVLGEGRFERLDDGKLDLGSVCRSSVRQLSLCMLFQLRSCAGWKRKSR